MINEAYDYLIDKTTSIVAAYSDQFPIHSPVEAVCYRILLSQTVKTLSKKRLYTTYNVNAIVRGGQDSSTICANCDLLVEALDMNQDGVSMCLVTSEPQYAYTDDNGNLNYAFPIQIII